MPNQVIQTDNAPAAIGPYSQAVNATGVLYVSGQIPLDPKSGEIVSGGISGQTTQVLENMKAIVEAAGGDMSKVVKVTIYIVDMQQFATVNQIYGTYFSAPFPARACVEVSKLPKGVEVEMDAIVHLA
jgi:2-iminobutanoate/2-iminopropanoate deaminase